jgi:diguanylate cyclase (GGDEF)-like protein
VLVFAGFEIWHTEMSLEDAYSDAGRREVQAIALSFGDDIGPAEVADAEGMQERLEALVELNPSLQKATVYDLEGGHGVRVAATDPSEFDEPVEAHDTIPIQTGRARYREEREDGEHLAELNHPLKDEAGKPFATIGLYFDLAPLDAALARSKRNSAVAALLTAALLVLVLDFLVGRMVFRPLTLLRRAHRRLAAGKYGTRLAWRRRDEMGALAADFDHMATELELTHRELSDRALTDSLTGLANHRACQEQLHAMLQKADRVGGLVAVVALDIDRFKYVNDRFGHGVGDDALRAVAGCIHKELRSYDLCGRTGGDEFMLALPDATAEDAEQVVERLRACVAAIDVFPGAAGITMSAGIAEFPRHASDQDEIMRLADGALYRAKQSGRDASLTYSSELAGPLSPHEESDAARKAALVNTVHALARAVDAKDGYTHLHSFRVAAYAVALGRSFGMEAERLELLRSAAVLHDVGKIGISEAILLKPAKLTAEEYEEMKRHSELGRDIIAGAGMPEVAEWVYRLHERPDGRGYPAGLSGDSIPFESALLSAADALEAMTSKRIYRAPMPVEDALAELERGAGTQFDPRVAERLVELVRSGELELRMGRAEGAASSAGAAGIRPAQTADC